MTLKLIFLQELKKLSSRKLIINKKKNYLKNKRSSLKTDLKIRNIQRELETV